MAWSRKILNSTQARTGPKSRRETSTGSGSCGATTPSTRTTCGHRRGRSSSSGSRCAAPSAPSCGRRAPCRPCACAATCPRSRAAPSRIDYHHITPFQASKSFQRVLGLVGGATGPEHIAVLRLRLRLVTSRGPPYPSRSPRAHPSGWTRTQGLSHRDSHAPPSSGRPPSGCGTGRWLLFYDEPEIKW